ncbi:type II toxin-antitoxin system HicA family toxin [Thiocystis violascens]|uniref:YcfA-like protein n=1 Tax=Thiocystis violascens (strain ATCC 17096 / DSM 198 / 6111) TaxID=765911 RepID=I3YCL2_THIV6|nr:type II toxin-antitoxin system HicA family toxin [Thiocystis violascens]AFL74730.1 YcfA-like protein [Thiocystis violascens DSM 198]
MKRSKLIQHLTKNGCVLLREGSRHAIWKNPSNGELTAVPRHSEIKDLMAHKICKDLKIQLP